MTVKMEAGLATRHGYTYEGALKTAERVNWKIEDIIGGDKKLDFTRRMLPEALARVEGLTFLTPEERKIANQIRSREYLYMFGLVEEFIVPFVLDHAQKDILESDVRTRSLIHFAEEETKHIQLFKRFAREFEAGFGSPTTVIGPPSEIAKAVLSHSPLAVALLVLHIEWFVQKHYLESIKDGGDLDPQFKSLLKHHWLEEAQHTKLDTLMLEVLAESATEEEKKKAIEEYLAMGGFLDNGLRQQTEFNLESFVRATGRELTPKEREEYRRIQHQALRWTYIGSGMSHPKVLEAIEYLSPADRPRIEEISKSFA